MIPESFIQEVLYRADIVSLINSYVPLKKAGGQYMARCPFHSEKTPSFTVSPTKQFYHCFGCGAHGTAIGFLMNYQNMDFVSAIHELARDLGLTVPNMSREANRENLSASIKISTQNAMELLQTVAAYYRTELKKSPRAITYLKERGLDGKIVAQFQIGYAPQGWQNLMNIFPNYDATELKNVGLVTQNEQGNRYDRFRDRIMFPIHNVKGQVIGFGGRVISAENTPKYYNSPETPFFQKGQESYGLFLAQQAIRENGKILVVEGYMDVVALAQFGINYAVATLGTATTPAHLSKLSRYANEIIFCFDGDSAGKRAAWRASQNFLPILTDDILPILTDDIQLKFLFLTADHDPDSFVRQFGKTALEAEINKAMPLSEYLIYYLRHENPLTSMEDKTRLFNDAKPIIQKWQKAHIMRTLFIKRVSELSGISIKERRNFVKLPRTTLSFKRRILALLLMQPDLLHNEELVIDWGVANNAEEQLLIFTIKTIQEQPQINPQMLWEKLRPQLTEDMEKEISPHPQLMNDMELDLLAEFKGAWQKLCEEKEKEKKSQLLHQIKEKKLSELTEEEKETYRHTTSRMALKRE